MQCSLTWVVGTPPMNITVVCPQFSQKLTEEGIHAYVQRVQTSNLLLFMYVQIQGTCVHTDVGLSYA